MVDAKLEQGATVQRFELGGGRLPVRVDDALRALTGQVEHAPAVAEVGEVAGGGLDGLQTAASFATARSQSETWTSRSAAAASQRSRSASVARTLSW